MNAGHVPEGAARFGGRRYSLESYDRHLSLKAPLPLLLCLVFLCRPVLLRLLYALSNLKGQAPDISVLWSSDYQHYFMLASLPAFAVLGAYYSRAPYRGAVSRWIWRHGAWLAAFAALAQSVPALLQFDLDSLATLQFEESPLLLALHAAFIGYLLLSKRVRDTFSDYPAPTAK